MLITVLLGLGLVGAGMQLGRLLTIHSIVKNPDIIIPLIAESHPNRVRIIERSPSDENE